MNGLLRRNDPQVSRYARPMYPPSCPRITRQNPFSSQFFTFTRSGELSYPFLSHRFSNSVHVRVNFEVYSAREQFPVLDLESSFGLELRSQMMPDANALEVWPTIGVRQEYGKLRGPNCDSECESSVNPSKADSMSE